MDSGDTPIQGLGLDLNLGRQGDDQSGRKRSRVQSLGVSNFRKRVQNSPGIAEGLPPPSE